MIKEIIFEISTGLTIAGMGIVIYNTIKLIENWRKKKNEHN